MKKFEKIIETVIVISVLFITSACTSFADSKKYTDEELEKIDFTPRVSIINEEDDKNVRIGESGQYEYVIADIDDFKVTAKVTFSSDDQNVLSVTEDGRWKALQQGTTTVWYEAKYTDEDVKRLKEHFGDNIPGWREEVWGFEVRVTDGTVKTYRVYNPNSGEHFYTQNLDEKDGLVKLGWRYEGVAWNAPDLSNTEIFRLYNPNAGEHFYTTNANERDSLVKAGWNYEGLMGYAVDADMVDENDEPVYRLYNPNAITGTHHYTINADEYKSLIRAGWHDEKIAWYELK